MPQSPSPRAPGEVHVVEQPRDLPHLRRDGDLMKPLLDILLERRDTEAFADEPVSTELLQAILLLAAQAPSGHNLQPWRFIVARAPHTRVALKHAANGNPRLDAPVLVVACGVTDEPAEQAEAIAQASAERGVIDEKRAEAEAREAISFLEHESRLARVGWLNRQVAVSLTTMMLIAEAYGYATSLVDDFDRSMVRHALDVPDAAEVIAILAIGRAAGEGKPYPGRLALEHLAFAERYGAPLELVANVDAEENRVEGEAKPHG